MTITEAIEAGALTSFGTPPQRAVLAAGQQDAALLVIESGLNLGRRLGEPHLVGRLLSARSYAMYMAGDLAGAARDTAEALGLFRQAGDQIHVGEQLNNLGNNELSAGDLDAARRHLAEAVDIFRALDARSDIVFGAFNLGLAEYLCDSPDAAGALFAESLDLARRIGMKANMAYALLGMALAGRGRADPRWSARLHGAADQVLMALGEPREPLEERLRRPRPAAPARRTWHRGLRGRIRRGTCHDFGRKPCFGAR